MKKRAASIILLLFYIECEKKSAKPIEVEKDSKLERMRNIYKEKSGGFFI